MDTTRVNGLILEDRQTYVNIDDLIVNLQESAPFIDKNALISELLKLRTMLVQSYK